MEHDHLERQSPWALDKLDLMLVRELEIDARQSNYDIASKIGKSPETVRRRINRLSDTGAISIVTMTNPIALGLRLMVFMGLCISPGESEGMARYLASLPNSHGLAPTLGRYDMVLAALFRDQAELIRFVERDLGGLPHLLDVELMITLETKKYSFKYLHDDTTETTRAKEVAPLALSETDLALIEGLEVNPRETIANLADKLGMNRLSISKRLIKLQNNNIVRTVCLAQPTAVGMHIASTLFLKVRSESISSVANVLVQHKRVHHVGIVTGNFNICVWATFRDPSEMYDFCSHDLGRISGIIRYEAMVQVGRAIFPLPLLTRFKGSPAAGKSTIINRR